MGDTEVNNLLIVESENDKFFIEALLTHINLTIKVDKPICSINEYNCIGGIGKLKFKLEELKSRILKGDEFKKIGIIFDADMVGIDERKKEILKIKNSIFNDIELSLDIFIMNLNGKGELETILKKIKSKPSPIADCLSSWQDCLKEKKLTQKELDKFWIQIYQRYDCCTKQEKKQAYKKCNNEISLKEKSIYNFDTDIKELKELKVFLELFRN